MADENKPAFYPRVGNITPKRRAPLAQTEVREQPLDPIMRTFKDLMDRSSALLDKSKVSPFDVTKGLISAIPFEGERFAKDFEQSTMPIPTGFGLLPKVSPQGLDTSEMGMQSVRVPTKEALNELKWSDLVGTAGASRMFEALGQNRTPELFDTLDATMLGLGGLSAARAAPKVAKAVGEGAKTAGMGGLEMINRGMFGEGPLRNFVPQHKMIVKEPNGNWLRGSVEDSLKPLKRNTAAGNDPTDMLRQMRERYTPDVVADMQEGSARNIADQMATLEKQAALNKWVESNLSGYVKKQMGTAEDPVRKLAEEGIIHMPSEEVGINRYKAPEHRERLNTEQLGQSDAAKAWEDASDVAINPIQLKDVPRGYREPWMDKASSDTGISHLSGSFDNQGLGFDHILDVLREDVTSGRIRPEQLNKVSMEQAVRRTYEYDQELARRMNEARATSRAELPVYKDYPEGYRWVQLTRPGDFAAESDAMGHSVRGYEPPKGHPDWTEGSGDSGSSSYGLGGWDAIKRGEVKVYSLVDAKGEPHATIEVGKGRHPIGSTGRGNNFPDELRYGDYDNNYLEIPKEKQLEIYELGKKLFYENPNAYAENRILSGDRTPDIHDSFQKAADMLLGEKPGYVRQIKGKGNARPIEKYDPYTQDFVKSGGWSDVKDLQNTGLQRVEEGETPPGFAEWMRLRSLGTELKIPAGYYTPEELVKFGEESGLKEKFPTVHGGWRKNLGLDPEMPLEPPLPPNEMKRGGKVSISSNPDTMMMELGNQKFGIGGLATVAKNAKKVAEPMKASEALGMIEGRPLKITQSDRTKVGGGYLGGPGFSSLQLTEPQYRAAEAAWGVQNAGTAKTILGGGKKGDNAVYAAMLGTPTQHQSNQMVFDKLYGDFKKAAKRGELTPELRDLINTRLAASVDKKGNPVFPADVDILDKNFRNIADTFSRRSIAGHLMGGVQVGGKKGQIIDYDKIIRSTTDPALLDLPTGALGNRLFTLSGGIIDRPDLHPAFPAILQGEDLGLTFTPVERNLVMKDFVDKTMREKKRMPGYMDYTRGNPPTQLITEDILTELQKLGLKEGGAVHKAEGGEVTGDDLILEERPL